LCKQLFKYLPNCSDLVRFRGLGFRTLKELATAS
jgi:hypothetical protein